jgi:prepilin-type N-terminal cleavage/methylation domain-containing protein
MKRRHDTGRTTRGGRTGFTLVELLVVITIMGMLMAIIFPAFEGVRELARQTNCSKNVGALGTASLSYESTAKRFPGLVEANGKSKSRGNESGNKMTWAVALLDNLGNGPLYKSWEFSPNSPGGGIPQQVGKVSTLVCPSDSTIETNDFQPLSYAANSGLPKDAQNIERINKANGVFFNRYVVGRGSSNSGPASTAPYVSLQGDIISGKGAAYTILFAENLQAGNYADKRTSVNSPDPYDGAGGKTAAEAQMYTGFVWNGYGINMGDGDKEKDQERVAPNVKWSRPSSNHPNGVFMAFCSGNGRFVRENIEAHVFRWLCVSNVPRSDLDKSDLCKKPGFSVSDGDF